MKVHLGASADDVVDHVAHVHTLSESEKSISKLLVENFQRHMNPA